MSKLNIIYSRVSTEEQASDSKTSLSDQTEKCRDYLAKLGYDNILEFQEDHSGYDYNRPELDKVKELIQAGKVRSLTFLRVDRLTRQPGHLDELREGYFIKYNVEVHSTDLGAWTWAPSNVFMQNSLVNFSQLWGKILVGVMKDGKIKRVKNGHTIANGIAPFGYSEVREEAGCHFEIEPVEAEIIRNIFSMYVEDDMSLARVARKLTTDNVPTFVMLREINWMKKDHVGKWYPNGISSILRNKTYIGLWTYAKYKKVNGKRVENENAITVNVPPIVDIEIFKKAQKKLADGNKPGSVKSTKLPLLMARRLTCACGLKTGHQSSSISKANKRYTYYRCFGTIKTIAAYNGCDCPTFPSNTVDNLAWEWLSNLLSDTGKLKSRIENYINEQTGIVAPILSRVETIDRILSQKNSELESMMQSYFKLPELAQAKAIAQMEALEIEIKAHQSERESLTSELSKQGAILEEMERFIENSKAVGDPYNALNELVFETIFGKDTGNKELTFAKKQEYVKKFNLQGKILKNKGEWQIELSCILGNEILPLLYNVSIPIKQFSLTFTDILFLK